MNTNQITFAIFLKRLSCINTIWHINKDGEIRNIDGQCPIEAVFSYENDSFETWEKIVPLNDITRNRIIEGADTPRDLHNPIEARLIRSELIYACGLLED